MRKPTYPKFTPRQVAEILGKFPAEVTTQGLGFAIMEPNYTGIATAINAEIKRQYDKAAKEAWIKRGMPKKLSASLHRVKALMETPAVAENLAAQGLAFDPRGFIKVIVNEEKP